MPEKKVQLYCSHRIDKVQHIANYLETAGINYKIVGEPATTILFGYNPTQQSCILVFQGDYIPAKAVVEKFLKQEEEQE